MKTFRLTFQHIRFATLRITVTVDGRTRDEALHDAYDLLTDAFGDATDWQEHNPSTEDNVTDESEDGTSPTGKRGRKRKHATAADRQRAYRERQAEEASELKTLAHLIRTVLAELNIASKRTAGYFPFVPLDAIGLAALGKWLSTANAPTAPQQGKQRPKRPYYEVLGVRPNCSKADARKAWAQLVPTCHPDKVAQLHPELQQLAHELTAELNNAKDEGPQK